MVEAESVVADAAARVPRPAVSERRSPAVTRDGFALYLDGVAVRREDREAAFRWIGAGRWECAAPFRPYSELALNHGDEEERTLTHRLVIDLRQPVYDARVLFVRCCEGTDSLLAAWQEEQEHCRCERYCGLPFLRAVWRVKPLLLALPAGWVVEGEGATS